MTLDSIAKITEIAIIPALIFTVKKAYTIYKGDKAKRDSHRQFIVDTLDAQNKQLSAIQYQLYPNGSLSMFDRLMAGMARLEAGQVNTWELMDLAVWLSDKDGKVTFVTNSLCEMIGCSVSEMLGNTWKNRIIEEERAEAIAAWKFSVETASEFNRTITYKKSDGMCQTVTAVALHNKDADGNTISSAGRFQKQGEPFKP